VTATICAFSLVLASMGVGRSCSKCSDAIPPKIFRGLHGLRVHSYEITPVTGDRRSYRAIEAHRLENLMLDQIPESSVEQCWFASTCRRLPVRYE